MRVVNHVNHDEFFNYITSLAKKYLINFKCKLLYKTVYKWYNFLHKRRKSNEYKNLVYTALMTAVICIFRPSTRNTITIYACTNCITKYRYLLQGVILGRKYGALSVIIFLLLAATGLPLLSGGRGGIGVLQVLQQDFYSYIQ